MMAIAVVVHIHVIVICVPVHHVGHWTEVASNWDCHVLLHYFYDF